jgi:hypothetical protein
MATRCRRAIPKEKKRRQKYSTLPNTPQRTSAIRDPEALADVLLVIATRLFEASRAQEAVANAEEEMHPRWKRNAEEYTSTLVRALTLAATCRPSSEAGGEYTKEAHRPQGDLERTAHLDISPALLSPTSPRECLVDLQVQ